MAWPIPHPIYVAASICHIYGITDKGEVLVVLDRAEYNNKVQKLLEDRGTYKEIKTDPTNRLKTKLIKLLKKIKAEDGISEHPYKKMCPTGTVAPKFYGLVYGS